MSYAKYNVETGEVDIVTEATKTEDKVKDPIDEILNRYRKYQIDFIDAETETNINSIRDNSKIGKLVKKIKKQFASELEKLYPNENNKENLIVINYVDTEDLVKAIDEEIENRKTMIKILESDLNDAKTLLAITETYEQKMQILKNYNIIDEKGRINIYE